jgi:hypothetical protein
MKTELKKQSKQKIEGQKGDTDVGNGKNHGDN